MKIKRFKIILIYILILFLVPININADVQCSTVQDAVDDYNSVVEELDSLDCSNTLDNSVVIQCNNLRTDKSLKLSKLFKYNDLAPDCNNPELKQIINDNEDVCSNVFGSTLKETTNSVMGIFYIIAPFLLIIFGSIDFSKIVVMNDPKTIKQARGNFFKRLAAFVLLYMVPFIVNLILNFNFSGYSLTGNVYSCKTDVVYHMNRWDVTYVPPLDEESDFGSSGGLIGEFNGLYTIRSTAPVRTDTAYQGFSNVGQCVWFARSRAIEIVQELIDKGSIDSSNGATIISELKNSAGNAGDWDSNNAAQKFKTSSNINDLKAPAIIVWKKVSGSYRYGHVGIIEDVSNDRVKATEAWSNAKDANGDTMSCPGTWDCIEFRSRDYSKDEYLSGFGAKYTGSYSFSNYIYFTELK